MARLPRLSVAHHLHLVTQRVQAQVPLFEDGPDRSEYLECLAEAAARFGVAVHAYGLSPAEVRLLATPNQAAALGQMVQQMGRQFVAAYNKRHGRSGTLWEGRFRSTVVDPAMYFTACLRYVEDPALAGALPAAGADAPPWNSADHHGGKRADALISEHACYWTLGNTPFEREVAYRRLTERPWAAGEHRHIAAAAAHGWVLGDDRFAAALSGQLNRRLRPLAPGRPRAAGTKVAI